MKRKIFGMIAASAFGVALMPAPAQAAPVLCETLTNNHMFVDSAFVTGCVEAGVGNIGNGQNDDFLNSAAGAGFTDVGDGSFTQAGSSGTFSVGAGATAVGFKFGTGNQPDEWFIYSLAPGVTSGSWSFVNVFGTGGGLSHVVGYSNGDTPPPPPNGVPEPASMALLLAGLAGAGLARRKLQA